MPTKPKKAKKLSVKGVADKGQNIKVKKVKAVIKKADTVAKKNPWVLAGITAGLGLAVGLLSAKGKSKKKK